MRKLGIHTLAGKINEWFEEYVKLILLGLIVALIFALGFDVIQNTTNHHLSHQINGLKNDETIASEAAIKACKVSKPRFTALLKGLGNAYARKASTDFSVLNITSPESPLFNARENNLVNDQSIVNSINSFLPIRCSAKSGK